MAVESFGPTLKNGDEVFGPNIISILVIGEVFGPMFISGDEVFGAGVIPSDGIIIDFTPAPDGRRVLALLSNRIVSVSIKEEVLY